MEEISKFTGQKAEFSFSELLFLLDSVDARNFSMSAYTSHLALIQKKKIKNFTSMTLFGRPGFGLLLSP